MYILKITKAQASTEIPAERRPQNLPVRTRVRAGGLTVNHSQAVVRVG